MKKYIIKLG